MSTKNYDFQEKYRCSIEHFIEDEYSVCREERQYAVFLYNILRKYRDPESRRSYKKCENDKTERNRVEKTFDTCGIPEGAIIEEVFYEATFMRDFFERDRRIAFTKILNSANPESKLLLKKFPSSKTSLLKNRINAGDSFNAKLLEYVHKGGSIEYSGIECNYGSNKIDCESISDYERFLIRCMMNAKPDIAVVYNENKQKFLLFLECKFESDETNYTYKIEKDFGEREDKEINNKLTQRKVQWRIADFLCNHYLKEENIKLSDKMKNKMSCLVQFTREKKNDYEILISDLIELDTEIFSK